MGIISLSLPACARMQAEEKGEDSEGHSKIVVTTPQAKDVTITQPYVCQIHARRYTEIKALQEGYLEAITVKEGQAVTKDQVLFRIYPPLYKAKLEAEKAEAQFARVELYNTKKLHQQGVVSEQEVKLYEAKLAKAEAKVALAEAELQFTEVKAPFAGIMDRLYQMQGSLVKKDEVLTNLSDNSVMWVYFNVPEARYLEYMNGLGQMDKDRRIELIDSRIELQLANGSKFKHSPGNFLTIEGKFNNETGNIAFRADFPNPEGLLRHGQTGTILIHRSVKNAVVIPQRATFETLDKQYVWVVGEDHTVHRQQITIAHELEDTFVIEGGISVKDKIVLEGVQQVKNNQKLEDVEFQKPGEALAHQKFYAE
jgi:membrane fusion protein (multidrug efflux system)